MSADGLRLAADADGTGGFVFPKTSVQSWTSSQIVLTIPANAPVGGGWVFVEVDGLQSSGLPYAVSQ